MLLNVSIEASYQVLGDLEVLQHGVILGEALVLLVERRHLQKRPRDWLLRVT